MRLEGKKVRIYSRFKINVDLYAERDVEVYVDQFCFKPRKRGSVRIMVMEEPLVDSFFYLVRDYPDYYDYVLTFRDEVLKKNPKARFFRGADIWSRGYHPTEKRFAVSTVVGGKYDPRMPGYGIRHDLWKQQEKISAPREFYLSDSFKWDEADYTVGPVLYGSKDRMFDCMFHVAIENTSIKHYFSEKLLDCFETKTVPIYYGCINVDEYFNKKGILIAHSLQEIIQYCNKLTPDLYEEMKPYMDDNFNRIQGRPCYDEQFKEVISNLLISI